MIFGRKNTKIMKNEYDLELGCSIAAALQLTNTVADQKPTAKSQFFVLLPTFWL
jgi:hypothetical protein